MAFDFIEASSSGYKYIWAKRQVLGRLLVLPIALKILTLFVILAFSLETNFLRQGLLFLPSYFVEGWLIMQVIRMAFFKESWSGWASGGYLCAESSLNAKRHRIILSGTIIYVLIKLTTAFISGMMAAGALEGQDATRSVPEMGPYIYLGALLMVVIIIWSFRLLWLYVPVALNYPILSFLKKAKGFSTSFYMLGVWILCFVPVALIILFMAEILGTAFPGDGENLSTIYKYGLASIQALAEVVIALVSSVSMAYGIRSIIEGTNKSPPLL